MKSSILKLSFISLTLVISFNLFGQLKVSSSGNVGIQLGTETPFSALSIGGIGTTNSKVSITGNYIGLNATTSSLSGAGSWTYGILGRASLNNNMHVGVRGESYSSTPLTSYRSWGLLGIAGNATSGYNYGVMGLIMGANNGSGIVGIGSGASDVNIDGIYAGYFVGNVKVTGVINGIVVGNSDKRYKKNIANINSKSTLNNVLKMSPVEYNLNQLYMESKGDSAKKSKGLYDENAQFFKKKHFGLIAQDLQELYPDLVYEDDNGYLSINYIGIIPLLIESIKELKAEVDDLSSDTEVVESSKVKGASDDTSTNELSAVLYQNTPNPFSHSTEIKYYLSETVTNALLCIYNLQGKQLKQISIIERGNGSQTINGSEFSAGIYLYGLIADGQQIDVKRMILTE